MLFYLLITYTLRIPTVAPNFHLTLVSLTCDLYFFPIKLRLKGLMDFAIFKKIYSKSTEVSATGVFGTLGILVITLSQAVRSKGSKSSAGFIY